MPCPALPVSHCSLCYLLWVNYCLCFSVLDPAPALRRVLALSTHLPRSSAQPQRLVCVECPQVHDVRRRVHLQVAHQRVLAVAEVSHSGIRNDVVMARLRMRNDESSLPSRLLGCSGGDLLDAAEQHVTLRSLVLDRLHVLTSGLYCVGVRPYVQAFAARAVFTSPGTGNVNSRLVPQRTRRNCEPGASGRSARSKMPISGSGSASMVLAPTAARIVDHPRTSQAARRCSMFRCVSATCGVSVPGAVIHAGGIRTPCTA